MFWYSAFGVDTVLITSFLWNCLVQISFWIHFFQSRTKKNITSQRKRKILKRPRCQSDCGHDFAKRQKSFAIAFGLPCQTRLANADESHPRPENQQIPQDIGPVLSVESIIESIFSRKQYYKENQKKALGCNKFQLQNVLFFGWLISFTS